MNQRPTPFSGGHSCAETSLPATVGYAPASSTPAVTLEPGHPRVVGHALSRIAHFIASILEAPCLPVEPFIALMGLPIKTLPNSDIFFRNRRKQSELFEPDAFSAEYPFRPDMWLF